MSKRLASIIMGGCFVIAGLFIAWAASQARGGTRYDLGPTFFPKMAGYALAALGLYTMIHEYFKGERVFIDFFTKKFLFGLLAFVGYTALLMPLGYIVSGISITFVLMFLICNDPIRKVWPYLLAVGILAPLAVYWIFAEYLLVPLPMFSLGV